jgi:predicted small metal-binding protein
MHMLTLLCRETGLDCDYVIKGETEEEILTNGAEHAMKVHGMKVEVRSRQNIHSQKNKENV